MACAWKFDGAGLVVHVLDEDDADGALLLRRQHLAQRLRGFGGDDAVEQARGIVDARLAIEDERDAAADGVAVVVVPALGRDDAEAGEDDPRAWTDRVGAEAVRIELLAQRAARDAR